MVHTWGPLRGSRGTTFISLNKLLSALFNKLIIHQMRLSAESLLYGLYIQDFCDIKRRRPLKDISDNFPGSGAKLFNGGIMLHGSVLRIIVASEIPLPEFSPLELWEPFEVLDGLPHSF